MEKHIKEELETVIASTFRTPPYKANTGTKDVPQDDLLLWYITIGVSAFILIIGLLFNIICLAIFASRIVHHASTKLDQFLLSINIALLLGIFVDVLPYLLTNVLQDFIFGYTGCKFLSFMSVFVQYALAGLQVAMAIQAALRSGKHGALQPPWRNTCALFGAWLLGMLAILEIFMSELIVYQRTNVHTCIRSHPNHYVMKCSAIFHCFLCWVLPFFVIIVCYPIALAKSSRNDKYQTHNKVTSDGSGFMIYRLESQRSSVAVGKGPITLLFLVGLVYLLCTGASEALRVGSVFHEPLEAMISPMIETTAALLRQGNFLLIPLVIIMSRNCLLDKNDKNKAFM